MKGVAANYKKFLAEGGLIKDFDIKRKHHNCRSDTHDDDFIKMVQSIVDEDPGQAMHHIAANLVVSHSLICRVVKEDLRYKSYCLKRGQFMSERTKTLILKRRNCFSID